MEAQKVINLLNDSSDKDCKFATKNGILQTVKQQKINATKSSVKFQTESIKSNLCDYFDAFILVTGDITVARNNNT